MTQTYIFQYVHKIEKTELKMNIDITDLNYSISNGEHDGLTKVTNSEEDELNRNKIKISKDFLITKGQKKNKDNELKPLFTKLMEQVKEFSNDKIQLMFVMKAQELQLKFKSEKKTKGCEHFERHW